jgi:hypothetical protein
VVVFICGSISWGMVLQGVHLWQHPHVDVHLLQHLCCLLQLSARVLAGEEHCEARQSSLTWTISCPAHHMQLDERRRAAQPPPPGGWQAGSTSPSSPQGLETRSRKRARTHSASSPPANSNCTLGAVVDAQRDIICVTTDSYQGNTAKAYRTWLQSIDQQNTGKPASLT